MLYLLFFHAYNRHISLFDKQYKQGARLVTLSFLECYELLDISEDSDWGDIRKRYKSLIQQCHPDRFLDNPEDLQKAELLIRQYNAAFKQISDFYQSNKSLPPRNRSPDDINTQHHEPRKKRPPVDHESSIPKRNTHSDNSLGTLRFSIITILIFGLVLSIIYQFEVTSSVKNKPASKIIEIRSQPPPTTQDSQPKTETSRSNQDPAIIKYFSIGSGIGEVILSQGGPTHIEDNIWYYGKSSVTFHDGVVADWYRHPDYPLNVEIKNTSEFQSDFLNQKKEKKAKAPYWNQNR